MLSAPEIVDSTITELGKFVLSESDGDNSYYLNAHRHEYVRTVSDMLRHLPPDGKAPRILELGAFFGVVSIALAKCGYEVTAADIPDYIENPEQQERFRQFGVKTQGVKLQDFRLPFPDEYFDAVIMCEVLEHLNFNPLPLLKEINRIIAPGGLFYLSLPNFARTKNRIDVLFGRAPGIQVKDHFQQLDPADPLIVYSHWREYTMPEVREMLERLGFGIARHYSFSYGETLNDRSPRKRLGRLFYRIFPGLKENQTAIAVRERRTELSFAIPPTVHEELREF